METALENPVEEVKRHQRCINDLVSILTLPAIWMGGEPSKIVGILLDTLVNMLDLDFAYARLADPAGKAPIEIIRLDQSRMRSTQPQEISELLDRWFEDDPQKLPAAARKPFGAGELSIVPFPLALQDEIGLVVIGSERADFPRQTELLLLSVASNQAAIGLQESRLRHAQKRIASELDQKIREGTAELRKSNEALVAEIAERKNVEQAMRENRRLLRAIVNNSSAIIFAKDTEGRYLLVNRQFEKVFHRAASEMVGKDDYHFLTKEQADALREFDGEVMRCDAALEKEETLTLEDGTHTYIVIKSALRDASGRVHGLCGIATDITERKRMVQALRQSEEQYRVVVETANEAIVSIDEEGRILFANPATATVFGHAVAELIGQPLMILVAEAFRPLYLRAIRRYRDTGKRNLDWRSAEVLGRRKNGEEFPVEVSFGEVVKDGHRVFTGCIRDITERKKAEAVQAAQAQLAGIRADVSGAFSEGDNLRNILNACAEAIVHNLGAAFARIWTLNESENVLQLQASAGLYTRLDGAHARVPMGQLKIGRIAAEGKPHLTNDVPHDERVGDRDWARREGMVAFAGYPLFVEGRVTGVLAMFARRPLNQTVLNALESVADIVAQGIYRKDAEDKLRQRERSLRLLTETIPQMIWSATASGEVDYCNRQIVEYTGRWEDQLRGNGWAEVIHPDDLPAMQESWRSAVANQRPFEVEFRQRRADGMFRWCLSRAQPLCDEQGRVLRWYGAITDLDDWKRAQETARRTQAELAHLTRLTTIGELTASIAHEVNQPLGAVVANANACLRWLNQQPPNLDEAQESVRQIIVDGNRGSDVVTGIRKLLRKEQPHSAPLDINTIVREIIALLRGELGEVVPQTELADDLPTVVVDRVQLQQVLLNLIMNAVEAMKTFTDCPRVLRIKTSRDGTKTIVVSIQDSGPGLKAIQMEKLFEPFYTTKPQGLGMGLSICRSIIERHGGRLWSEPNPGPGVTFKFNLPCEQRTST